MPLSTFVAAGDGTAVDDLFSIDYRNTGCYSPSSGDPLPAERQSRDGVPDARQRVRLVNLSCGCVLAGSDNPSPGSRRAT